MRLLLLSSPDLSTHGLDCGNAIGLAFRTLADGEAIVIDGDPAAGPDA